MAIMIQLLNLCFEQSIKYPDTSFETDKVNFIVGRSGSGKSLLLGLLNKTVEASSGSIYLEGAEAWGDILEYRKQVQLVGQNVYLFKGTIRDNFQCYCCYRDVAPPLEKEMRKFLRLCLADFNLDHDCADLSGGEKQRVYLAIQLFFTTNILLLDEPTAALDNVTGEAVLGNIIEYCKEQSFLLLVVCHDQKLVERYAESIYTTSGEL